VQAWALANLSALERINGTHVVYFIPNQGGDCDNPDYTWVFNKGSELVTRTENTILILPNYTALRNLTKYNHDVVIVDDWTYTGPDGNTYTTLGGVFKRIHPSMGRTLTENGGTIIAGIDGSKWERDWDKIHAIPDWWECGGYNELGTIYVNKNISTNGKIDGIYSDVDRINAAQVVGDVVQLLSRVYEVDAAMIIKIVHGVKGYDNETQPYFGRIGSVIRDKKTPNTTLTSAYSAGSNTFVVNDASQYRCGQYVMANINSGTFGGSGYDEAVSISTLIITNISGNTITVSNGGISTVRNAPVNATFGRVLIHKVENNFEIKNVIFDGQWDISDNYVTYDWRCSAYISGSAWQKDKITDAINTVQYCKFMNIPTECINSAHLNINDCSFNNIGGGVFHHGVANVNKNKNHIYISNLLIDSITLIEYNKSLHEEAIFTFSNNTQNVFINNVRATNIVGRVIGDIGTANVAAENSEEDGNIWIDNCYFEGRYESHHTATPSNILTRKTTFEISNPLGNNSFNLTNYFRISNTSFVNTGDIVMLGQTNDALRKGLVPLNIAFDNCLFTNVRIHGRSVASISIKDCKFYHRPNYGTFTDFTFKTNVANEERAAFIHFTVSDDIVVEGCLIEGDTAYNQYANYGICFAPSATYWRKNASGVNTKVFYSSKLRAINNVITGCTFGIGFVASPTDNNSLYFTTEWDGLFLGCEIKGNTIILEKNAENLEYQRNVWGIYSLPGVNVSNNYIQFPEVLSAGLFPYGIVAIGVTNADKTLYAGSVIRDNKIISKTATPYDIQLSHPRYYTPYYNTTVMNNVLTGDIFNATNHYLQGNIKQSTVFPVITNPYNIPDEIYLFKNKSVY
jgi:hypothetical protein